MIWIVTVLPLALGAAIEGDAAREDEFLDQAVRDGDRALEKGAQGFAEGPHVAGRHGVRGFQPERYPPTAQNPNRTPA